MKNRKILFILILLALLLRGVNLPQTLEGDETDHALVAQTIWEGQPHWLGYTVHPYEDSPFQVMKRSYNIYLHQPPFSLLIFGLFSRLPLGFEISLRLAPFFFGILTLYITYLLGKEMFSEKAGMIAVALGTISRYHIFHSSFNFHIDGSILTFLVLLTFYFYVKWDKTKENKYIYLSGISSGLALLSRVSGIILIGFLVLFELYRKRTKFSLPFIALSFFPFALWIAVDKFITGLEWSKTAILHNIPTGQKTTMNLAALLSDKIPGLGMILLELTPPLTILLLVSVFYLREKENNPLLLSSWIAFVFIASMLPTGGDKQRYFSIALPFIFLLVGRFISEFKLRLNYITGSSLILLVMIYFANVHDYMFFEYKLYGTNGFSLLLWALPFSLILPYFFKKKLTVSILVGAFIAYNLYFSLFSITAWPIAHSEATNYANQAPDNAVVASRSVSTLSGVSFYDWREDGKIDREYLLLSLDNLREFEKYYPYCEKFTVKGYPLLYVCHPQRIRGI